MHSTPSRRPPDGARVTAAKKQLSSRELIALVAAMMALTALSIDLVLPAFDDIRIAFDLAPDSPATAGLITSFFFGMALTQLAYGTLSDRFGRKRVLYAGLALFAAGSVGAAVSTSMDMMLISRFIWGLGAAGPRVITLSVIRDVYEGEHMARIMSFIMAVFILIPMVAPSIGAGLIAIAPWRSVFWFCTAYAVAVALWTLRLPETLQPGNRIELNVGAVLGAVRKVVTNRQTMGYTISLTLLSGVFLSYLASSERIWEEVFDRGDQFPLIFGGIAAVLGIALVVNGLIVGKVGVTRVAHISLAAYPIAALVLLAITVQGGGTPGFWIYVVALTLPMTAQSLLIPNFNTLALAPVGEVAGTASAVIGTISTAGGALLGTIIDRAFDGSVTPLSIAFVLAGIGALLVTWVTERGKLDLIRASSVPKDVAAAAPPLID